MMLNGLLEFRITQGKQWLPFQVERKKIKPQAPQSERSGDVQPIRHGVRREFRPRQPEKIDQAHDDKPDGYFWQKLCVALQVARKQEEERHEEMKNQHDNGHNAPASVQAAAIEGDLFRQVAGPDDQKL